MRRVFAVQLFNSTGEASSSPSSPTSRTPTTETAEDLVHGLSQAIQKRGLPRALLTDNGAAMVADELTEGLLRLGIVEERKSQNLELYSSGIAERASVIVIAHNTCSRYDRWNDPWGNNHEATAGRVG